MMDVCFSFSWIGSDLCEFNGCRVALSSVSLEWQHWAPRREPEPETVPMPDPEFGEGGAEGLAALAKPLIRKKKPTINLSRWKAERNSKNNDLDGNEEHLGTSSLSDESNLVEKLKITSDESKIEGGQESVSRPRVAFTLPLIKNAGMVEFTHFIFVCCADLFIYCFVFYSISTCSVGCALFL